MILQRLRYREAHPAEFALMYPLAVRPCDVLIQANFVREAFRTMFAPVRFLRRVHSPDVSAARVPPDESSLANAAYKWSILSMDLHVFIEMRPRLKATPTHVTHVRSFIRVNLTMISQGVFVAETFPTRLTTVGFFLW